MCSDYAEKNKKDFSVLSYFFPVWASKTYFIFYAFPSQQNIFHFYACTQNKKRVIKKSRRANFKDSSLNLLTGPGVNFDQGWHIGKNLVQIYLKI